MNAISIVLFGMPRSIDPFLDSIEFTLLKPMRSMGIKFDVVGELNVPNFVNNPRSRESGTIEKLNRLTNLFVNVKLQEQDENRVAEQLNRVSKFGDSWSDNFHSLSNLLHQQQSLISGTKLALDTGAEHFIFIRPDLIYHDDFTKIIRNFSSEIPNKVIVPAWQFCGGLNDRFALITGRRAAEVYGFRMKDADCFVARGRRPLHSERLLAFSLGTSGIKVEYMTHRASRCRIDGAIQNENFSVKTRVKWRTNLRLRFYPQSFA